MTVQVIGVTILTFIASGIVCALIHEFGHWIVAKIFGGDIKFRFEWGKLFGIIPIPRGIWDMPEQFNKTQKKFTAAAGFGFEFIASIIALLVFGLYTMLIVSVAHIVLYQFYAGEASDFKWL